MRLAVACTLALTACATAPDLADPARAGVWGYLSLVPRDGAASSGDGYGDRRLRDAELVDYTRPGFAVVYLEGRAPSAPPHTLEVRAGLAGVRLEPGDAAIGVGGEVELANRDGVPHVVSCPAAGLLRRIAPGESLRFEVVEAGELACFVPNAPATGARIFAAPGPFAVVDESGRYELLEVEPGTRRLHAWHPRMPPRSRPLELAPGQVHRMDLELGVGLEGGGAP